MSIVSESLSLFLLILACLFGEWNSEEMDSFTRSTSIKILKAFGQGVGGAITHSELTAKYSRIVQCEKEMLTEISKSLQTSTAAVAASGKS